jgi:hypothetical protein
MVYPSELPEFKSVDEMELELLNSKVDLLNQRLSYLKSKNVAIAADDIQSCSNES